MGTRKNRLVEAVLMSTHNLCSEQKHEKYQTFLSVNFHFLVVKFSVYLNRRVFIMIPSTLVISTLLISNNRLSRNENLVLVFTWKSNNR